MRHTAAIAASLAVLFVSVTPTHAKVWEAACKHGSKSYAMIYDDAKNTFVVDDGHKRTPYKSYGIAPSDDDDPRVYLFIDGVTPNDREFQAHFVKPDGANLSNETHPEPKMTYVWRGGKYGERMEATDKCTQTN